MTTTTASLFKNSILDKGLLALSVIVPIVLICLPADFFDTGESLCLSQLLFHKECWGCGMTRACMHLIHFDVAGAYYYNALSFVVLPILVAVWAMGIYKRWNFLK